MRRIVRKLILEFTIDGSNHYISCKLLTPDYRVFSHYHRNCWGDYHFPNAFRDWGHLVEVKNELEKLLETIDLEGTVNGRPRNLPKVSTLVRYHSSHRGEASKIWAVRESVVTASEFL